MPCSKTCDLLRCKPSALREISSPTPCPVEWLKYLSSPISSQTRCVPPRPHRQQSRPAPRQATAASCASSTASYTSRSLAERPAQVHGARHVAAIPIEHHTEIQRVTNPRCGQLRSRCPAMRQSTIRTPLATIVSNDIAPQRQPASQRMLQLCRHSNFCHPRLQITPASHQTICSPASAAARIRAISSASLTSRSRATSDPTGNKHPPPHPRRDRLPHRLQRRHRRTAPHRTHTV